MKFFNPFLIVIVLFVYVSVAAFCTTSKIATTDRISLEGDSLNFGKMTGLATLAGQIGGPELIGAYWNIRLFKQFSINFGLSPFLSGHIGMNIYPVNLNVKNKHILSLYTGVQYASITKIPIFEVDLSIRHSAVYFPLGVEFIPIKGTTLQIEAGYFLNNEEWNNIFQDESNFSFAFRIGKSINTIK